MRGARTPASAIALATYVLRAHAGRALEAASHRGIVACALARAAQVKDIVTRAISGHATETMQHHYSTVAADEKKAAIAKVIELAGVRRTLGRGRKSPGGMDGGMDGSRNKKAAR